jgi:murein DD-endopeptidase MepM/ murein hydrolase activator NlpD
LEKPTRSAARLARRDRAQDLPTKVSSFPAALGVVALVVAGLGTFASTEPNVPDDNLISLGYETAGSPRMTATQAQGADDGVDVSRGVDRPELEQRTARLATQRGEALADVDRDITATAEVREREEKERAQEEEKRRNQWVLPVTGYRLSARFGQQSSLWSSGAHTGLDFAGPAGSEIVSVAAGTVTSAGYEGSYGNRTVVTLPDGTKISYCHQSRFVADVGEQVQPGQPIGFTGSTGNVTGPHLHLEIEPPGSGPADPAALLRAHGVTP